LHKEENALPPELAELQRRVLLRLTGSLREERVDDDGLDARVGIYEDMYFWRLREALASLYPRTTAALGDDFDAVVRRYFAKYPSRSPSLRHLGAHLPEFFAGSRSAALIELALTENARLDVFDAPDVQLMTYERVQATPPDAFALLPIHLVPAHRLLEGGALLVARRGVGVYERRLDALEAALLPELALPVAFGVVCEKIAARAGEGDAPRLGCELLSRWIGDQLLAAE
jgi:hypothetical protein